jgi:hypothetical protein
MPQDVRLEPIVEQWIAQARLDQDREHRVLADIADARQRELHLVVVQRDLDAGVATEVRAQTGAEAEGEVAAEHGLLGLRRDAGERLEIHEQGGTAAQVQVEPRRRVGGGRLRLVRMHGDRRPAG